MRQMAGTVLGLVLLTGCTTAAPAPVVSGTPAAGPSSAASPSDASSTRVIEITLADGKADPLGARVELPRGSVLRLKVTSDRDDEVHVHGYDVEIPVTAGRTVTRDVVLDQVGRFEVESHEPPFTILQVAVS